MAGSSAVASISKDERKKQLGAERAAESFQARTGIDPRTDRIVVNVAGVTISAEQIEHVRHLTEWFDPTRRAVRGSPSRPPECIERALRAASTPSTPSPPMVLITFGNAAGIAPGKRWIWCR